MTIFSHESWDAGQFLTLYGALLVIAIYLGFAIPRHLRTRGRQPSKLRDDQAAYLSGGPNRYFELVIARLMASGAAAMAPDRKIAIHETHGRYSPDEARILALPSPVGWGAVEEALRPGADLLRNRLVAEQLVMHSGRVTLIRICQVIPYLLLIALGVSRWRYGNTLDHPTGYLTVLLILTLALALTRWLTGERRTRGGIAAVEEAQARAQRLLLAPTVGEFPLAVALFGTVVLASSSWNEFHQMRTDSSNSNDGGGCGGGGGGCGGCGGCGG